MPSSEISSWVTSKQKRRMDLLLAKGIAVPSALIIGVAACVSIFKEHEPPFFTQSRIGIDGDGFKMFKLRTMPAGTPEVRAHNLPDDVVTSYQQRIRRLRINELPQVANVLLGDMSVVGPRPQIACHREETLDNLTAGEQKEWLRARSIAVPGLLDPYIVDKRINDREADDPVLRAYCDIEYAFNGTYKFDMRVLFRACRWGVEEPRDINAPQGDLDTAA